MGLAGLSDTTDVGICGIFTNAFVTLCIIGALQVMKNQVRAK
jgi:hypothetical protein